MTIGEKVLGWFIVQDTAVTAAVPQAEVPQASVGPRAAPAPKTNPDPRAFAAIYREAGIADDDCERLTRVLGLVGSLPEEASQEMKRAIVGASLQAFAVPIERI